MKGSKLGQWIAIGVAVGTDMGVAVNTIGLRLSIGIAIGAVIKTATSQS